MNAQRPTTTTAHRKSGEDHPANINIQNEWCRIPTARTISTVSRSTLYANFDFAGGAIKTASIRKRGATRGIRMVNVPSLLAWLNSFAEQASPDSNGMDLGACKSPTASAMNLSPNQ